MGGEASLGSRELIEQFWGSIGENGLECVVVPKAGHWVGDENRLRFADCISSWINKSEGEVAVADLEWLHDRVTLDMGA